MVGSFEENNLKLMKQVSLAAKPFSTTSLEIFRVCCTSILFHQGRNCPSYLIFFAAALGRHQTSADFFKHFTCSKVHFK